MTQRILNGKRVLILEDEFLIALDVEQICAAAGAREVTILRRLEDVANVAFDVAIVDLMLGDQSTLDFARSLARRGIPFVFATGYSDIEGRFEEFAGVPVLDKPYDAEALMAAIATAFAGAGPVTPMRRSGEAAACSTLGS